MYLVSLKGGKCNASAEHGMDFRGCSMFCCCYIMYFNDTLCLCIGEGEICAIAPLHWGIFRQAAKFPIGDMWADHYWLALSCWPENGKRWSCVLYSSKLEAFIGNKLLLHCKKSVTFGNTFWKKERKLHTTVSIKSSLIFRFSICVYKINKHTKSQMSSSREHKLWYYSSIDFISIKPVSVNIFYDCDLENFLKSYWISIFVVKFLFVSSQDICRQS